MQKLDIYNGVFIEILDVGNAALSELSYQSISQWDSVGHMRLMAGIESAFGIMLDTEDIVGFSSYETGKEILRKYGVEL